jgi:hypothetical protein
MASGNLAAVYVCCVVPQEIDHELGSNGHVKYWAGHDLSGITHNADLGMDECSLSISSATSINLRKEPFKALT